MTWSVLNSTRTFHFSRSRKKHQWNAAVVKCVMTSQSSRYIIWQRKTSSYVHTYIHTHTHTHTHTHLTALFPGLPGWAGTRKVIPIWILLKQRDSEWQWHQLGYMQVCTSLQTDNHASTPPLNFLRAGCPSCHPTNSIKALKSTSNNKYLKITSLIKPAKSCYGTPLSLYYW